jgi:hypothetical protein
MYLAAMLWIWLAPERLYYCCDDVGPMPPGESLSVVVGHPLLFLFTAMPPFAHYGIIGDGGKPGDYYIWQEPIVYGIWIALFASAILWPWHRLVADNFRRLKGSMREVNSPSPSQASAP